MSTIVTRSGKGSPLSHVEVDANFNNLNTDKVEKTAAAITGGTINNTTIGATTPSTVNATTLSGETGVLRGTGNNLLQQSQTIATSPWAASTGGTGTVVAPTNNEGLSPDGTTTATRVRLNLNGGTTSSDFAWWRQNFTSVSGLQYTFSFYAKSYDGTSTYDTQIVDITNAATAITITPTWTRFTVTANGNGIAQAPGVRIRGGQSPTNSNAVDILMWGAQLELGSTANTYIPTTTTAVYGTPTLSFSGVSTIGLQSNGALFLQPAGTGAIQAQATTSTTAGGNVRGANAVDWQTARNNANQVASGQYSVMGGGIANRTSSYGCLIAGGESNLATGFDAAVLGGASQQATGGYATAGGGLNNIASGSYAGVLGGYFNTAAGFVNFIGGGERNSGTANASVTTQSGTMNATTAVTLSGSNANIKVGQLITGTSIVQYPNHTYVAAISGTSLTLSQAASGSSTSTLSFFTPHGVVVGGGNNQATGSYSFIGGGGDAGTAANRNVASGDWSFVGGGRANQATGIASTVGGGGTDGGSVIGNQATGVGSTVVGGAQNISSNFFSTAGGRNNIANGNRSTVFGAGGLTRSIRGYYVFAACQDPISGTQGTSQAALLILAKQTTDATPTELTSNGSAASGDNQVILPNNSAYFFRGEVISGVTGGGNTKGWTIEGVIKRGANAASTALVGIPTVTSTYADVGAATWDIAVTADTTNGGIRVTFTGQAATTIRTVARITTVEMTF